MRGIFGTALFYSDGMITPTISVPPTVGGVKVAESSLERWAVLINVAILLAPFMLSLTNRGS
jgi:KUP system potassium uptake protein